MHIACIINYAEREKDGGATTSTRLYLGRALLLPPPPPTRRSAYMFNACAGREEIAVSLSLPLGESAGSDSRARRATLHHPGNGLSVITAIRRARARALNNK